MSRLPADPRESMTPPDARQPMIHGNIPAFLGARPVRDLAGLTGLDVVMAGLPWEGTNTWGGFSGCEQTPKACRLASVRYGSGYLPEYDVEVMRELAVGDMGDLPVSPSSALATFAGFEASAGAIFDAGVIPVFLGGDHGVTYPLIKALAARHPGRLGLIHFDAHLDNAPAYGEDTLARCCPLRRIAETPDFDPRRMVHVGIRGPRNAPSQMRYARQSGATVLTMADVRRQGLAAAMEQAKKIASEGTDGYYVTVCSDILDHANNPGGPLDFGGLTSSEMLGVLHDLAKGPLLGLDLVEVYPQCDTSGASTHLVVWEVIYALAGLALARRGS